MNPNEKVNEVSEPLEPDKNVSSTLNFAADKSDKINEVEQRAKSIFAKFSQESNSGSNKLFQKSTGPNSEAKDADNDDEQVAESEDIHFDPIVKLEAVQVKTNEEQEDCIFKIRAKLFRFNKDLNEWKERGTGDVKFLQHKDSKRVRLVMRRDKTLKVCANHYIMPDIIIAANVGSDRSWVYSVAADMSDGVANSEMLAIRFSNSENAKLFKEKFLEAQVENAKKT